MHADITLHTYPSDPNHAGMIYYELTNQRIDFREVAGEVSVIVGLLPGQVLLQQGVPLPAPVPTPAPAF